MLVFLGGVLIDKYGLVRTSIAFNLCIVVGMIVFASAPRSGPTMTYLLAGRLLLGVGGECICVCASAMIARWFKHSSLTFALGFHSALVQLLGSAPTFVLLPYLLGDAGQNRHTPPAAATATATTTEVAPTAGAPLDTDEGNVRLCLWVTVLVCAISLLANLVYAFLEVHYGHVYITSELEEEFEREMNADINALEMKREKEAKEKARGEAASPSATASSSSSSSAGPAGVGGGGASRSTKDGKYSIVQSQEITPIHVREANGGALIDQSASGASSSSPDGGADGHGAGDLLTPHPQSPSSGDVEHTSLMDNSISNLRSLWEHTLDSGGARTFNLWRPWMAVRALPPLFWLVALMQVLLSPILYSFSAFGPLFFMEKYGVSQEEAGLLTSLLYLAIILAPFIGLAIDRVGYRCIIQTVAAAFIPLMFLCLHSTAVSPYLLMGGLGLAFAIVESNGLAMIAEVSPSDLLGTSYGIVGCGTSFFLLIEPYIVGYIHMHSQRYTLSTLLFIVVAFLGWAASFVVYVYDVNTDNTMTQSVWGKREADQSIEMSEQNQAYPELEIVFDHDDDAEDDGDEEEQLFSLDDVEAMEGLDLP